MKVIVSCGSIFDLLSLPPKMLLQPYFIKFKESMILQKKNNKFKTEGLQIRVKGGKATDTTAEGKDRSCLELHKWPKNPKQLTPIQLAICITTETGKHAETSRGKAWESTTEQAQSQLNREQWLDRAWGWGYEGRGQGLTVEVL